MISFYAKASSGTPSIGVEVQQNFGTGGSPSATVSTPLAAKVISTSWAQYTATVTVPSITGKTLGTTANTSYLEVNLWISSGATNATRASSIGIQNNTFSIWGVKLEAGTTATAFSLAHPSMAAELSACQRYYYRMTQPGLVTTKLMTGYCNSTTNASLVFPLPAQMRALATLETTGTAANYIVWNGATNTNCSAVPSINSSYDFRNVWLDWPVASGLTSGQAAVGGTNTTNCYLGFNSEL